MKMTDKEALDRCVIIRDTLMSDKELILRPTLKNIEWVTMCAEFIEEKIGVMKNDDKKRSDRVYEM